ncbi:hypothetical protein DFH07DRAFT_767532 [Mycena maculata]|uniref:Uncharacterized protein n=1 Tax=Mycena maculata TaxID=230809 RepID=A0AAD7JWU4_9AGAR|nr:hypothetical protein DFH07DRAFT_767532 [Mycena maculata]
MSQFKLHQLSQGSQQFKMPGRCSAPRHNETVSVLNSVTVAARNSGTVAAASHMLANLTLIPFTYEKPMARMVDISYALKLQRRDHEPADPADHWVLTDAPIEIKDAQSILCLQLPNVRDCIDGPRPKRRLSDVLVNTPSPIRLCSDCTTSRPQISPINFRPVSSPTLKQPIDLLGIPPYSTPEFFSFQPIAQPSIEDADNTDNSDIEIVTPLLTPPTASSKSTPKSKFPLKYAYQMNQGFMDMAAATAGTIERKFEAAFDMPWTHSSYYTHHDVCLFSPQSRISRCSAPIDWDSWASSESYQGIRPLILSVHIYPETLDLAYDKALQKRCSPAPDPSKLSHGSENALAAPGLGGTGLHSNEKSGLVDLKLRELFKMGLISIPLDLPTSSESGSPGKKIRIPTPMPETRLKRWKGSLEEYNKEHDLGASLATVIVASPTSGLKWAQSLLDPRADVKLYDPKVVVVNLLGDSHHQSLVTRYHELDLFDAIRFHGRRFEDDNSEDEDEDESSEPKITTLEDLDPSAVPSFTAAPICLVIGPKQIYILFPHAE